MATKHKNKKAQHNHDMDDQTQSTISEGESSPSANTSVSNLPSAYFQEKPISIRVGPKKTQYFIHKALLAAKSPFFSAIFKECWDGNKEEVELSEISSTGFEIVTHWMYSGQLPAEMSDLSGKSVEVLQKSLIACKAADVLMMRKLQNALIVNEAAYLVGRELVFTAARLKQIYDKDLCHTKYYDFVLHQVAEDMMKYTEFEYPEEEWVSHLSDVEDNPRVLADMLKCVRKWRNKPWKDFIKGDLSEFLVNEVDDLPVLSGS